MPTRLLRLSATGHVFGDPALAGNLLTQGDNPDEPKDLLPFYRGRVKCIFIAPPYSTKSAFEHYDDNLGAQPVAQFDVAAAQLLRELLSDDGSIWLLVAECKGEHLRTLLTKIEKAQVGRVWALSGEGRGVLPCCSNKKRGCA